MLLDQLQQDLKQAQLQRNETKVSTIRMLISEINNAKIAKGGDLEDAEIVSVVQREVKKRTEAAAGFRKGSREEAAQKEEAEAKILEIYLPAQISDEELTKAVEEAITECRAKSIAEMGKVISLVRSKVGQGADGSRVSALVKQKLLVNR